MDHHLQLTSEGLRVDCPSMTQESFLRASMNLALLEAALTESKVWAASRIRVLTLLLPMREMALLTAYEESAAGALEEMRLTADLRAAGTCWIKCQIRTIQD